MQSITYKDSPFLSLRTLFMFGIPLFFSAYFLKSPELLNSNNVWALLIFAIMIIVQVFDMFYFQLHSDRLTVKHHILFFLTRDIYFDEIQELEIHKPQKSSLALKVYFKNGKKKNYSACTINYPTWRAMIEELKIRNVQVNNLAV